MQSLQTVLQQKILKQLNKEREEPLESIYITFYSIPKNKLDELPQARQLMHGFKSVHLQKQQSESSIKNEDVQKSQSEKPQQQKQIEKTINNRRIIGIGRTENESVCLSENKLLNSSVSTNKYRKNNFSALPIEPDQKKLKGKDIWQRRKEYDTKVRKNYLPKINEQNKISNSNPIKYQSGQNTAEMRIIDVQDSDEEYEQQYNQRYYKKQLFLWQQKQKQFDFSNNYE